MRFRFFSRTTVLFLSIFLFSLVLIAKLFLVQVVHSNSYSEKADRQYSTPSSNIFERGTIFFQKKDGQLVSAATQTSGFKLAINPTQLVDIEDTYEKIATQISIDYTDFLKKANKKDDPYEEIANHLTKTQADNISALKISGVSLFKEKWRFYPGGELASHSLGFVGFKGDDLGGRYGLEKQYDDSLSRSQNDLYVNFFAEIFSDIKNAISEEDIRGGNVVTTIEPTVQDFLEQKIIQVQDRYKVDSIGGIIMNPKDGSIYALGVKPDFDPNNFSKVEKISIFSNPLVENVFEFGSVVKPLVIAAALDKGVVTASTKYEDKGSVIVEKKEIFNFDKKARGVVDMQEVLGQSLNTGMVFIYRKLGKQSLHDYLLAFGLKEKTGIDLPNETGGLLSGLTSNLKNAREIEYTNASFGQGIAFTPMALVRALSSLANGGSLVTPHVVRAIRYDDGTEKKINYITTPTKISPETSEEMTRMLVGVMDKSLRGGLAKLEHYSVAVKTGTAQVAKESGGGYYEDRNTHSFFGYFPAYDPQFIVFLYAVNPKGVRYASETWADPFLDITKFLLNYYEVPPDR